MKIRLLRGQVVIREITAQSSLLWSPVLKGRDIQIHRGTVLAKGPPMLFNNKYEMDHGFEVGDEVLYIWVHNESTYTREWEDGQPASWIPQQAIQGVIE